MLYGWYIEMCVNNKVWSQNIVIANQFISCKVQNKVIANKSLFTMWVFSSFHASKGITVDSKLKARNWYPRKIAIWTCCRFYNLVFILRTDVNKMKLWGKFGVCDFIFSWIDAKRLKRSKESTVLKEYIHVDVKIVFNT